MPTNLHPQSAFNGFRIALHRQQECSVYLLLGFFCQQQQQLQGVLIALHVTCAVAETAITVKHF